MKQNKQLNNLVMMYKLSPNDEIFTKIYETITQTWRNLETVAKSVRADIHEITALYEDVLLKCIERYNGQQDFINFYRFSLTRARADLYRKKKRQYDREYYESPADQESDLFEILCATDEDTTAATVISKKEADQRQLIDFLLSGADELTTAIVKEFLEHPKLTPTAIGNKLGLHHSTVSRKLTRLASKYDSKQFGDYTDYLVAL